MLITAKIGRKRLTGNKDMWEALRDAQESYAELLDSELRGVVDDNYIHGEYAFVNKIKRTLKRFE